MAAEGAELPSAATDAVAATYAEIAQRFKTKGTDHARLMAKRRGWRTVRGNDPDGRTLVHVPRGAWEAAEGPRPSGRASASPGTRTEAGAEAGAEATRPEPPGGAAEVAGEAVAVARGALALLGEQLANQNGRAERLEARAAELEGERDRERHRRAELERELALARAELARLQRPGRIQRLVRRITRQ